MPDERRLRFHNRVDLERNVLASINNAFKDSPPLAALSEAAIAIWAQQIADKPLKTGVVAALSRLSAAAGLRIDASKEVFSGDYSALDASIRRLCEELEAELKNRGRS